MKYTLEMKNVFTEQVTDLGTFKTKREALHVMYDEMDLDLLYREYEEHDYYINGEQYAD